MLERIEQTVTANLPVLPFDANAATEDGALRALLEALGTPVGNADMQIASIALQAISLSSRELARLMCVGSFSP